MSNEVEYFWSPCVTFNKNPIVTLTPEQAEPIQKFALKLAHSKMKLKENKTDEKDLYDRFYNWKLGAEAVRTYLKVEKPLILQVEHGKKFSNQSDFMYYLKAVKVLTVQNIQKNHIIRKHYDFPFLFVFTYRIGNTLKFEIAGVCNTEIVNDEKNHDGQFKYGLGLKNKDKTCFTGYNQLTPIEEFKENYSKQVERLLEGGLII